ncbi:tyrosinase family oxidase copper chaperone [Streptomyces sp. NPDC086766]|uniref:apotyrosinase chaperone MelC1 n=1 Tax=Streptomyces sp. NPDC086766 TaxID=3365754 RepID=UPI0037F113D9
MPELSRRRALTVTAGLAAAAGAGAVTALPASAAGRPARPRLAGHSAHGARDAFGAHDGHEAHDGHHDDSFEPFDEVYLGRRIQGRPANGGGHGEGHHHGTGYAVFVDGAELHVMRNADGSWISVVSHYDPVPTPRAAARAAVDELRGARLVPFPAN